MPLKSHMWKFPVKLGLAWRIQSRVLLSCSGFASKLIVALNRFKVVKKGTLDDFITKREKGRGLITVSNHDSCLDEPILWGFLGWKYVIGTAGSKLRWTMGADNVCFKRPFHAWFCTLVKTIPVIRGDGVYQKGVNYGIEKINAGDWMHIYPEAKVNADLGFIRYKWGVGRMIVDSDPTPIILPVYHLGMDDVSPNSGWLKYYPRMFQKVTVVVGEEINVDHILQQRDSLSKKDLRKQITDVIQEEMLKLKKVTESIHNGES